MLMQRSEWLVTYEWHWTSEHQDRSGSFSSVPPSASFFFSFLFSCCDLPCTPFTSLQASVTLTFQLWLLCGTTAHRSTHRGINVLSGLWAPAPDEGLMRVLSPTQAHIGPLLLCTRNNSTGPGVPVWPHLWGWVLSWGNQGGSSWGRCLGAVQGPQQELQFPQQRRGMVHSWFFPKFTWA